MNLYLFQVFVTFYILLFMGQICTAQAGAPHGSEPGGPMASSRFFCRYIDHFIVILLGIDLCPRSRALRSSIRPGLQFFSRCHVSPAIFQHGHFCIAFAAVIEAESSGFFSAFLFPVILSCAKIIHQAVKCRQKEYSDAGLWMSHLSSYVT